MSQFTEANFSDAEQAWNPAAEESADQGTQAAELARLEDAAATWQEIAERADADAEDIRGMGGDDWAARCRGMHAWEQMEAARATAEALRRQVNAMEPAAA